ncbi:MAG: V-type ATPase subunit [Lachnospiraceae bacterium]|nr:V-type ATPase subunit [Lachnospiraceae bacterium]
MGSLLSYSGLTTKLRAMESHLIREEGYRRISEMGSVGEVVGYLKRTTEYRDILADVDETNIHRGEVERLLITSMYRDFIRIYRFADPEQKKFLTLYMKRYELAILKRCFRMIFDHRDLEHVVWRAPEFLGRHTQLDLPKLSGSKTLGELIGNLKGTEYYAPLSRIPEGNGATLFDYEMALDLYYFGLIWKQKDKMFRKQDLKSITQDYGVRFDLTNLNWICRSRAFYQMSAADVYALLIPVTYRLRRQEISRLVEAGSEEEFSAVLDKTYYGKKYEKLSAGTLEDMYLEILQTTLLREARNHPYSVASVYSFLYQKERELDRLTTALECVRYRLAPSAAYQLIMKS